MKTQPLPLLLLAAEAGEKLTAEEWDRLGKELDRVKALLKRLAAVTK